MHSSGCKPCNCKPDAVRFTRGHPPAPLTVPSWEGGAHRLIMIMVDVMQADAAIVRSERAPIRDTCRSTALPHHSAFKYNDGWQQNAAYHATQQLLHYDVDQPHEHHEEGESITAAEGTCDKPPPGGQGAAGHHHDEGNGSGHP